MILRNLAILGSGFDCSSENEMKMVLDLGVEPERIIFANPCKQRSCIQFARRHGVTKMTFDNFEELRKVRREFPAAELLLRIGADDPSATIRLEEKFGASTADAFELLRFSQKLGLEVIGVSFHVGTGSSDFKIYREAIENAKSVFSDARRLGIDLRLLDIGGGFSQNNFDQTGLAVSEYLEEFFEESVEVMAEPGRYFAEGAFTLACTVIGKRIKRAATEGKKASTMIYLNDGVYGTLSNCIYEDLRPTPRILRNVDGFFSNRRASGDLDPSRYVIWGPTCDAKDCLNKECDIEGRVDVGDWLCFDNMGGMCTAFAGWTAET